MDRRRHPGETSEKMIPDLVSESFVAGARLHEARNGLATVRACIQLCALSDRAPGDPRMGHWLSVAERQLDDLECLLTDNLAGEYQPSAEPGETPTEPASSVVGELVDSLEPRAEVRGIHIETTGSFDSPLSLERAYILRRVMHILLDNALVHTGDGLTLIRIHGSRRGTARLLVEISDDGGGIPTSKPERLFQPFDSVDSPGSGLGLFLARQLAREYLGGDVSVRKNDDGGATFSLFTTTDEPRTITPPGMSSECDPTGD